MGITTINNEIAIKINPPKMKHKRLKRIATIETLLSNSDNGITFLEPDRHEILLDELDCLHYVNYLEGLLFNHDVNLSLSERTELTEEYRKYLIIDSDYRLAMNQYCSLKGIPSPFKPPFDTVEGCH